jgi:flagellar motor switch protein FliN
MSLTPEIAADVVTACEANAGELASALGGVLGFTATLTVGEPVAHSAERFTAEPGLVFILKFGGTALAAVLPSASGMVPDWCAAPDATGASKLSTLAQELSMLVVPDSLLADDFQYALLADVQSAIVAGEPSEGALVLPLTLAGDSKSAELSLVWPLSNAERVLQSPPVASAAPPQSTPAALTADAPGATSPPPRRRAQNFSDLPAYSRSLLKVTVPITVCLATKKQAVSEIIALGPGSIIMFDKACDAPLDLTVADHPIAIGEAVKVGEKFGLEITQMILPGERFRPVQRKAG